MGAPAVIESVDPFIGTDVTDLPAPDGLAASWWWPKPQIGNTHPGATSPFGMVSACAYSGGYPTGLRPVPDEHRGRAAPPVRPAPGVGVHPLPAVRAPARSASTTTTSASRPMLEPLDALDTQWALQDEVAEPGYYAATLELGHPQRAHRRPQVGRAPLHVPEPPRCPPRRRLLARRPGHRATAAPCRCGPGSTPSPPASPRARSWSRACRWPSTSSATPAAWRQMLWYDRRLMAGGSRLEFDAIRLTTLRPFGLVLVGPDRLR